MPKLRSQNHSLASLIDGFTNSLTTLLEESSIERARQAVLVAFGGNPPPAIARRRGRPPGRVAVVASAAAAPATRKRRKKAPIQLCPVPGCKDRAAPIFGMVCTKHKGIAKSKIRKYREARRIKQSAAA